MFLILYFIETLHSLNQKIVDIGEEDPEIFSLLLKYIYQGYVQFESAHIIPLLAIADRYDVPPLTLKV